MRHRALLVAVLLVAGSVVWGDGGAREWEALQPGDVVFFLIPANDPQPSAPTDSIVFTGSKVIEIDVTGCGAGTHDVQQYMIIDPTGKRSPNGGGIVATTTNPIRPGTMLETLSLDAACSIGGVPYFKWTGTVAR